VEETDGKDFTIEEFGRIIRAVKEDFPNLGHILFTAAENRLHNLVCHFGDALGQLISGPYLMGLEELFKYLDIVYSAFESEATLNRIAFLVKRARADFEIAFDALLAGINSVVLDNMRDVMEIEYLLYDFTNNSNQIHLWINCSLKERKKNFRPSRVRERHAKRLGIKVDDMSDNANYELHSGMLHVNPSNIIDDFAPKGFTQVPHLEGAEFCFWEIFEHAKRLVFALHELGAVIVGSSWTVLDPKTDLPNLRNAHARTWAVLALFLKDEKFKKV
jgi:hypothetical protein